MCRVRQIVGLNNYDLSYTYFYYIVLKQNKIRPEWAADRERWFEMIQTSTLPRKRRKCEVRKSWISRLIGGGGGMPTNLLRAPRVLDPALLRRMKERTRQHGQSQSTVTIKYMSNMTRHCQTTPSRYPR